MRMALITAGSRSIGPNLSRELLKFTMHSFSLYLGLPFYFLQSRLTGKPQILTTDSINTI